MSINLVHVWVCVALLVVSGNDVAATDAADYPPFTPSPIVTSDRHIRLDVTSDKSQYGRILAFSVETKIDYRITNSSDREDARRRWYPVMRAFGLRHEDVRVTIDGKPVDAKIALRVPQDALGNLNMGDTYSAMIGDSDSAFGFDRWIKPLSDYIRNDVFLMEYAKNYVEQVDRLRHRQALCQNFEKALTTHLLVKPELAPLVTEYVTGEADLSHIVRLIPEAEPQFRSKTDNAASDYHSILNESSHSMYQAHETEWREKIDRWLVSKTEVSSRLKEFRQAEPPEPVRYKDYVLEAAKYLEKSVGLDDAVSRSVAWFTIANSQYLLNQVDKPTRSQINKYVVEYLFPSLHDETLADRERWKSEILELGFDFESIDLLTGECSTFLEPKQYWDRWQMKNNAVHRRETYDGPRLRSHDMRHIPAAIEFELPLKPGTSSDVSIAYSTKLSAVSLDGESYMLRETEQQDFVCIIPPAWRNAPLRVEVNRPIGVAAILSPDAPTEWDGRNLKAKHTFTKLDRNLHVNVADVDGFFSVVRNPEKEGFRTMNTSNQQLIDQVESKIAATNHSAIRWLLMASLEQRLLSERAYWSARDVFESRRNTHSSFEDPNKKNFYDSDAQYSQVAEACTFFDAFAISPDFTMLHDPSMINFSVIINRSPRDLTKLQKRLAILEDSKLTPRELLGKSIVDLYASKPDPQHFRRVVELAKANPSLAGEVVQLLTKKTPMSEIYRDFVLNELNEGAPDSPFLKHRISLLNTISLGVTVEQAERLIPVIVKTHDEYTLESSLRAIQNVELPTHFESFVELADRVLPKLERAWYSYYTVLAKSDPVRAYRIIEELKIKYPRTSFEANLTLANILKVSSRTTGESPLAKEELFNRRKSLLNELIKVYNEHPSQDEASRVCQMISELQQPGDLKRLKYRKLQANKDIISTVANQRGSVDDFDFVERYYRDNSQNHETYQAIAEAFASIGDPRATPYLDLMVPFLDSVTISRRRFPRSNSSDQVPQNK